MKCKGFLVRKLWKKVEVCRLQMTNESLWSFKLQLKYPSLGTSIFHLFPEETHYPPLNFEGCQHNSG